MLLKRSSAVYAVPLAFVLTLFYVSSSFIETGIDGYWESAAIRATSALLFIAPIASAATAWEIVRLRKGGALSYPGVRFVGRVLMRSLGPLLLGCIGCLAAGWVLLAADLTDSGGTPDYRVFAMGVAVLLGWSAVGAIAGRYVPVVIAAPACLIVAYVALAYPPSMTPFWVRHLTGVNDSCCMNTDRIATAAVVAPAVLAGGALVAAGAVFVLRNRVTVVLVAVGAVVATVLVAVRLVHGYGPDPVGPRPVADLVCAHSTVEVCLWPEHKSVLSASAEAAGRVEHAAAPAISVPRLASEAPSAWQFGVAQGLSSEGVLESLVIGVFPQEPPATCRGAEWPSSPGVPLLEAWIEARAGVSSEALKGLHSPALLTVLAGIQKEPERQQYALIRSIHSAVLQCSKLPVRLGPES